MKVHVVTDLYGNPDDRDVLFELSDLTKIDKLFGDKGYVGNIDEELRKEKDVILYALKRSNSKYPLPKEFRNLTSKMRRRIESTFNQLQQHLNIKRVRANTIVGVLAGIEIKLLCFNILAFIGQNTAISCVLNF